MSKHHEITLICPKCGAEGNYVVWDSVNNVISPEVAEKLIDGNLFRYECPECGDVNQVFYSCLYHDMEHFAMIQLSEEGEALERAAKAFDMVQDNDLVGGLLKDIKYKHRIVTDINALREKAAIFRDELDDRAVELMKLIVLSQNAKTGDLPEGAKAYYVCKADDGELILEFVGENGSVTGSVARNLYDELFDFVDKNDDEDTGLRCIDQQWALLCLTKE